MRALCWVGLHAYERRSAPEHALGRENPHFDRCRRCGHEPDRPLEDWDNIRHPFEGG